LVDKLVLSVIIPCYNAAGTIRETILSILASDFDKKFEIIVVDDGSTDGSTAGIENLNVKLIKQENKGAAAARNRGTREASADLIVFVDSDVVFFKSTLRKIYQHLIKDDVHYVSTRYSKTPLNNGFIHKYKALADYCYYYDFIFTAKEKESVIKRVCIAGGTEGYKKSVFEVLGGFDETIKGALTEQENLISELAKEYNMIADGNIILKHHFPDFIPLVKKYLWRTLYAMRVIKNGHYVQPYLKKNIFRVILAPLAIIALLLFLLKGNIVCLGTALFFLLSYMFLHLKLYILAFKRQGIWFLIYTIPVNFFFSNLISFAGFLGTIRKILR